MCKLNDKLVYLSCAWYTNVGWFWKMFEVRRRQSHKSVTGRDFWLPRNVMGGGVAERLDRWTCTPETTPLPPPRGGWICSCSEPQFKFTIKHVNSQLVYIGPVGLIINLVVFIWIIVRCKFLFLFIGRQPTMWPANNCLQITVCQCAMLSNCVWLQIIHCSCVNETTLFSSLRSLLRKNGRSLGFPNIFIKKQTRWSNDQTIICFRCLLVPTSLCAIIFPRVN